MVDFRIRLRSVRLKDGGAKVHVLHSDQPNLTDDGAENWRGKMLDNTRFIVEQSPEVPLDGYVVIGLWADGTRSVGYRMTSRIPRELFPAYIAEMLRTYAITENEAERTFDRRFEWVD